MIETSEAFHLRSILHSNFQVLLKIAKVNSKKSLSNCDDADSWGHMHAAHDVIGWMRPWKPE